MQELVAFFFQFLLAPLIIIAAAFIMGMISKGRSALKLKKLVIFVLLLSLVIALPSLFGFLKYEFIWGGLAICIGIYVLLGFCFNLFTRTKAFKAIGFDDNRLMIFLACFISMVLGAWIFYLVFSWASKLGYGVFAMTATLWFFIPLLYKFSKDIFVDIPSVFYKSWTVSKTPDDDEFWNTIDTFRLMQVNVRVKRDYSSRHYSSFSVKIPEEVTLGKWFNRFIEDQNIRFPGRPIEMEGPKGSYGWIFYTTRWLPIPLFTRMLDFEETVAQNRIKSMMTLYVRRVVKK